jgi:bifunctional DNase/RNase
VADAANEVEVSVVGVFEERRAGADQHEAQPVVMLRDAVSRELRIPVASCEGLAILVGLEQPVSRRPLTHDLALRLIESLAANLERVVIDEVPDDEVYYARLHLRASQGELSMEARPGDAMAMALRADVPIYVTEDVLVRAAWPKDDIR